MNPIEAARQLADARRGAALPSLAEGTRPRNLAEAEAVQHATLAALGEEVGGWKLGRHGGGIFSAPFPASLVLEDAGALSVTLPAGSLIELEIAIRFREAVPPGRAATLRPDDLPSLSNIAALFEFVQHRFAADAATGPLDRIADCVANNGGAVRESNAGWSMALLDAPPPTQLSQDGVVLARHEGPHVAAPIRPLVEAWIARLSREGRGIGTGEVLTFGSLTGMRPIPVGGALFLGEIEGLAPLRCAVLPTGVKKP